MNTGAAATPSSTVGAGILLGESGTNHIITKANWRAQGYIYPGDGTSAPTLNNANMGYCTGGGFWKNPAAITQIVFKASQKWTGKIYLFKFIPNFAL
jgi:hypothetical protein